jgi:hypothetical protein
MRKLWSLVNWRAAGVAALFGGLLCLGGLATTARGEEPDFKKELLALCDANRAPLLKKAQSHRRGGPPFYIDAYAIRALCVAYDLTDDLEYLNICKAWCDRMIEYQNVMVPKGMYDMNYGRVPGQEDGECFVADGSSIAEAILVTSIRSRDQKEKRRYLDSAEMFAKLVAERFVRPTGGVTDGWWKDSDKEWWCSTGIYGALMFELYGETGKPEYLKSGLGTIDYLNTLDLNTEGTFGPPEKERPSVFMYSLEAYSAGLPHLRPGTDRYEKAMIQFSKLRAWLAKAVVESNTTDSYAQWGSKIGGLPFHLYVCARFVPDTGDAISLSDQELQTAFGAWQKAPDSKRYQLGAFTLMSLAEKVAPGKLYRTSKED